MDGDPEVLGVQGLSKLTQYVEELARVVERPYLRSSQYNFLYLSQSGLQDLPGVSLNVDQETWLEIERLTPTPPPEPPASIKPWITPSSDPVKTPPIREHIVVALAAEEIEKLVGRGRVSREDCKQGSDGKVDVFLRLAAFPEYQAKVREYIQGPWSAWASKEKALRTTKATYEKIFSLQKSIEAGTVSKPLEILWGSGVLHWNHPQIGLVHHPLVEIPVEITIDPDSASVAISPIGRPPRWLKTSLQLLRLTKQPTSLRRLPISFLKARQKSSLRLRRTPWRPF